MQPSLKRKRDEIADSESEDCSDDDFGWVEDDELELVGVFDVHAETVV